MKTDRILIIVLALLFFVAIMPKSCAQVMPSHRRSVSTQSGAAPEYIPGTAVFDGVNDDMAFTSSGPTGLADGKTFTFSAWIRFDGGDGVQQFIFAIIGVGSTRCGILKNASNQIFLLGRNPAFTTILSLTGSTAITSGSGWVHVYVCVNLADTGQRKIYINGIAETLGVTTYSNDTLDYVATDWSYTVSHTAGRMSAAVAELWWNDSYLDSPSSFASGGKPISLGSDGSLPTGSAPVFYLKGDGNGFNVNSGTGGNFSITGSLGTTTPP